MRRELEEIRTSKDPNSEIQPKMVTIPVGGKEKEIENKLDYGFYDVASLCEMEYQTFMAKVANLRGRNQELDQFLKDSKEGGQYTFDLKGVKYVSNAVLTAQDRRRTKNSPSTNSSAKPNSQNQGRRKLPENQTNIPGTNSNESNSSENSELLRPSDAINLLVTRDIAVKMAAHKSEEINPVTSINLAKYLQPQGTLDKIYGQVASNPEALKRHFFGAFINNIESLWGKEDKVLDSELPHQNKIRTVQNQIIGACRTL